MCVCLYIYVVLREGGVRAGGGGVGGGLEQRRDKREVISRLDETKFVIGT